MIVDFRSIGHDFYGRVEQPVLTLKTPDGRVLHTITNYYGLSTIFRFNDVSEVEFSIPAYFEGEPNACYDDVSGMRLVEVEPFGDFVLINPKIESDGGSEVKTCKAYSLEYRFNFKRTEIPAGTYNFYNPVDNADTIMQMIVEAAPDWSIGDIDRKLIGRWRTFDNIDDNLYSFMMNTLQESYNCLFLFDTFNKKINVVEANRSAYNLPIYLSYNNLVKNIEITELTDDVVTALSGYGSGDEVNIRSVNPNGSNTIYNLDWFISKGDLPQELADKWTAYDDSITLYQQVFSNLNVLYTQKINEINLAKAKLSVLETDRDAVKTAYLTAQAANGQNPEYDQEIQKLKDQLDDKEAEIVEQQEYIETLETDSEAINDQIEQVISICKITNYFTDEEYKALSQYFKQDSIADDTFVIPEYSSAILQSSSNALTVDNLANIKIVGAEVYASNVAEIFGTDEFGVYQAYKEDPDSSEPVYNAIESDIFNDVDLPEDIAQTIADQLNEEATKRTYEFRGGNLEFNYALWEDVVEEEGQDPVTKRTDVTLKGDVVNVNLHYNIDNSPSYVDESSPDITKTGFFILTATLRNAEYRGTSFPNMNLSLQGKILRDVPQMNEEFISFDIESAIIYVTAANTEYQKQAIIQELYEYVQDSLEKLALPSYEFSVDSGNFIFAKEFEPFKDKLELGSTVNLALDNNEDNILQPILIEVQLNYEDESDFAITFSNKYRSSSPEFQLADLITEMEHQTHSETLNKAKYQAYKDSQAGDQIDNITNSAIDVVRNKIINSNNQAIEWDASGMFFRKLLPNGYFDGKQIGIINENIAFTRDNWESLEIAIGAFEDPNLGLGYGIIAPSIFGTLIAGENLVIENTVDDGAGNVVKQFKVDATGAWLHNSLLAFTKEPNPDTGYAGGKILIDPDYGIAAGNIDLFTLDGTTIVPSFWDDEEQEIIWDQSKVIETPDGSVYYVPKNTQFYFDINTGNAYFSGTISGENIVAETINGNAIINGSINAADKLYGDIPSEQMYREILDAINQYAEISQEGDKISLDLIGGLTNINFEGGTITADAVDAKNITGDLIEAINASIGKIDADKIDVESIQAGSLVMSGTGGKLVIDPDYGIAAGSSELFTINDDGSISPAFIDAGGQMIFDEETGAPLYSSLFFDINTGKTYFTGEINAAQITAGKLSSDFLDVKDGYITNAMIENLSAGKIVSGDISADVMKANVISAINAYVGEATISSARISDLSADKITSGTLNADLVTVTGTIDGNYADIINIDASNINTDTITTDFSNSVVGQIGNATIKSAMIENLSFDKITGFDINTTNLTIHSNDGKSTWSDNTIQISDENRVRVQIGEDANDDYSMYVWDADGNLMFDALGVTAEGIQRPIIKDAMVADDAAIQASKLDITSLFKTVNDNIEQIDAGSLKFDGKEFSVIFNTITTDLEAQGEDITSQGTALEIVQGQITNKIWQQDIDEAAGELETQFSTLQQDLNGFKVSVGQTYSEKSETTADVQILYTLSDSATTPPDDTASWSEIAPTRVEGKYIWQKLIKTKADGTSEVSGPTCISGADGVQGEKGEDGEDATTLRIDSSRGTVFKNNMVNTVLSVVIYKGGLRITDINALRAEYGPGAYLQWSWQKLNDETFGTILSTDERLGNGGFTFTLSPEDVDTKVVFQCQLII